MKQTTALLWKEWREHRWVFAAGLIVFLALPLLAAALGYYNRHGREPFYPRSPESLILGLGGLLAIVLATGAARRDMRDGLQGFWRSRPVRPTQLLLVKYAVGVAILLVVSCGPLMVQLVTRPVDRTGHLLDTSAGMLLFHTLTLVLIYSVSLLLGCLIGHGGRAAVLSFGVGLLIYFVPSLVAPLRWLDVLHLCSRFEMRRIPAGVWLAEHSIEVGAFIITMLATSVASVILACLAIRRKWHLEVHKRFIGWALCGLTVILCLGAGVQAGVTMECQWEIDLPCSPSAKPLRATRILAQDSRGVVLLKDASIGTAAGLYFLAELDLSRHADLLRPPVQIVTQPDKDCIAYAKSGTLVWSVERPDRAYIAVVKQSRKNWQQTELALCTVSLDDSVSTPVIHQLDLLDYFPRKNALLLSYLHHSTIFMYDQRALVAINISDPNVPTVGSVTHLPEMQLELQSDRSGDTVSLKLLEIPGLRPKQRLEATLHLLRTWPERLALDGDLLVSCSRLQVATYRLIEVDLNVARFHLEGTRIASPLARFFTHATRQAVLRDGMLFTVDVGLKTGLTVYDVRKPLHPRRLSSYTAADVRHFALTGKGRGILAGEELHIVTIPQSD